MWYVIIAFLTLFTDYFLYRELRQSGKIGRKIYTGIIFFLTVIYGNIIYVDLAPVSGFVYAYLNYIIIKYLLKRSDNGRTGKEA